MVRDGSKERRGVAESAVTLGRSRCEDIGEDAGEDAGEDVGEDNGASPPVALVFNQEPVGADPSIPDASHFIKGLTFAGDPKTSMKVPISLRVEGMSVGGVCIMCFGPDRDDKLLGGSTQTLGG